MATDRIQNVAFGPSRVVGNVSRGTALRNDPEADFPVSDDRRGFPELRTIVDPHVAMSSIPLGPLTEGTALTTDGTGDTETELAESPNCLGAPISWRAEHQVDGT